MDVTRVLLDILIVLVAAKLAAEGAERIGVPAVVGEIAVGVLIGPSALHLVGSDDVLRVVGELGVILLLLDVGLEMDLGELAAVGRAALSVATIGVVVPFALGWMVAVGLGMASKEAVFVGAALTATSVGITARVFGDLRALATVEARTVLGAAVADDVMGLVILTVVTRLVAEGSVSLNSVMGIVLVAIGFLAVASFAGIRAAPWAFHHVNRLSRSSGTLIALSLAFTLAMAELANQAKLAPIVGAFVAGLALSRSSLAPRIRRELTPVGHLLIPIFFVQIGLDAQVSQFARGKVLGIAAVLLVVAVGGKLVAAAGLWGSPGDKLLVGLGMIPRGEVGLIFATLGLSQGIIGRDVYASLLLVVLASTLMTPSLLKWRIRQQERRRVTVPSVVMVMPPGGWLVTTPTARGSTIDLVEPNPPFDAALGVGLAAATSVSLDVRAGEVLVGWLTSLPGGDVAWDEDGRRAFDEVLRTNDSHAWRFLLVTGLLDRLLPDVAAALRHRRDDPFETDPSRTLTWPRLEQLAEGRDDRSDLPALRLAALVLDTAELWPDGGSASDLAGRTAARLGVDSEATRTLVALVIAAEFLPQAAGRLDAFDDEPVLHVAGHLGTADFARGAFVLAAAAPDQSTMQRARLDELRTLVLAALAHPEISGVSALDLVEQRRAQAVAAIPSTADRVALTPTAFVLSQTPADLARQAALADPPLRRRCVRVAVTPVEAGVWRLDVAVPDEVGLLARQLGVLSERAYDVEDFATVVWPDKQSLSTFRVRADRRPPGDAIADDLAARLPAPVTAVAFASADLTFDHSSSPGHTICTVRTTNRQGALLAVARAVAVAGINVVGARATVIDGEPVEVLTLTDRRGQPVGPNAEQMVRKVLAEGLDGATPTLRSGQTRKDHDVKG